MKAEEISDAISSVDESLLQEADTAREGKRHGSGPKRWLALVACAAVVLVAVWGGRQSSPARVAQAAVLAEAVYPEMAPYPEEEDFVKPGTVFFDKKAYEEAREAWWEAVCRQADQPHGYADSLQHFFDVTLQAFLTENDGKNQVYSPANIYMALSMLAEMTQGESRQEILTLLGTKDMDSLRQQVTSLWNGNYRNDGAMTSVLANSVWVDQDVTVEQKAMEALATWYYASSYQGEMGSAEMDQALRQWLNTQTGGLLSEAVGTVSLPADAVLALASTVFFQDKWSTEFSENTTAEGVFYSPQGEVLCDYMHRSDDQTYYWGDTFGAIRLSMDSDSQMWLILPDEGVSVEQVLTQESLTSLIMQDGSWENQVRILVNLSMPKFDVMSTLKLKETLQELGVRSVFDPERADFAGITGIDGAVYTSDVSHAARVMVDEEGCTAVAYTVILECGDALPPQEEIDFVLERPFVFVITRNDQVPLFAGVVNIP